MVVELIAGNWLCCSSHRVLFSSQAKLQADEMEKGKKKKKKNGGGYLAGGRGTEAKATPIQQMKKIARA
jgi:hypothetical protein